MVRILLRFEDLRQNVNFMPIFFPQWLRVNPNLRAQNRDPLRVNSKK